MIGMDSELISVVVAVYNIEGYLARCVDSILNQTHHNLEIILVDDGSTDQSGNICDKYEQIDERIRVIHKPNGGLSDARNTGVEASTGRWIGFVDGDDYIHPQMYELMLESILNTSSQISVCSFRRVSDNALMEKMKLVKERLIEDEKEKYYFMSDEATALTSTVIWNKLYDRNLFDDIRFPVGRIHEDEFVSYKLIDGADRVVYIEKDLYYYFQREGSIMTKPFDISHFDKLLAYEERLSFYRKEKRLVWYSYILFMNRIYLYKFREYIEKMEDSEELIVEWNHHFSIYRRNVLWDCIFLPISPRKKIGYLFSALFSDFYYENRYRKTQK